MNTLPLADAQALIEGALTRSRTSPQNAASVARALVGAELAGQPGHGLRRVAAYAAQAQAKKVDGFARPQLQRTRNGAIHIDAGHGFAYPALDLAIQALPEIARDNGVALCGILRSHHCGVAGLSVAALAEQGLIAMMFANAPAAMAPWGATRPLFGTNPIAFAAPTADGPPVVIDISLSKVARGKVMSAQQKGESIPPDWAFGPDGAPTTDPDAAMAGTMAPMGEAKGVALALMVEMLAAGLTGARFSHQASSFFNAEGPPPGVGQSIIAIDANVFGEGQAVLARFAQLAQQIETTPGARVPGHRRQALKAQYEQSGIPADPDLIEQIARIGREPAAPART